MPEIDVASTTVYYETVGSGPPLVCCHGAFDDHRAWAELLAPLADRYRCVVYDARGHGHTGPTETTTYSIETYADDLARLIERLALERPVILGHSMGGMVAQTYAGRQETTIAGLCSISAISPVALTPGERIERWLLGAIDRVDPVLSFDRLHWLLEGVRTLRGETSDPGDRDRLQRLKARHDDSVPPIAQKEQSKIRSALAQYTGESIAYDRIEAPAVYMYGTRESATMERQQIALAEWTPDASVLEIPDAGHNGHVDQTTVVIDRLREFLETRTDRS